MLKMIGLFNLSALLLLITKAVLGNEIEVDTDLGKIRGSTLTSRLGVPFYAFRGIRYAEPPVGELRFLNPKPVSAWAPTVFNATADGPICPQPWDNSTAVSEDCLRLNVYTKDLHARKPVIVFLHPGGYYVFSSHSKHIAGPEHLMDRDCVLVSLNYRLGSLGFMATGTADAPGNAGLKDQVVALRWIKEHIGKFGGDAQSITLLGYSAGSLTIGLLMLSPMSSGLFHRGIAMSASPFGQWRYDSHGLQLAQRQARLLNCPEAPVKELVTCLRQKPMQDYIQSYSGMFEFGWHPVLNWYPVIEEDFGQERFLLENPYKTVQAGNFYKVPLITGITEFEFLQAASNDLRNRTIRDWLNDNFEKYAPIVLIYERNTTQSRKASRVLRQKYLANAALSYPGSLENLGELYSDALIGNEYHRFVKLMSPHTPIYTYLFRYKGRYSFFTNPSNNRTYGAVHHDELLYLFHVPLLTPLFGQNDPENLIIERLTRMVVEFAKKGNPHNAEDEYLQKLNWPLYTAEQQEYLEIGDNLTARNGGIFQHRFATWDELFPIPSDGNKKHINR